EAGAVASSLGREERFEDVIDLVGTDADAAIADLDDNASIVGRSARHANPVALDIPLGDRLRCVDDEVEKQLNDPALVARHGRYGREVADDPGAMVELVVRDLQALLDDREWIHGGEAILGHAAERLQVADHAAHAVHALTRLLDEPLDAGDVRAGEL